MLTGAADKNFFLNLITFVIDRINTCTRTCIICDAKLGFEMLKPSVCDKKICLYSHEQCVADAFIEHPPKREWSERRQYSQENRKEKKISRGRARYGLGEDIAATLRNHADVIDFLVSTCFAASNVRGRSLLALMRALTPLSQVDARRFNPFPIGIEVKQPAGPSLTFLRKGATANTADTSNYDVSAVNQALQGTLC